MQNNSNIINSSLFDNKVFTNFIRKIDQENCDSFQSLVDQFSHIKSNTEENEFLIDYAEVLGGVYSVSPVTIESLKNKEARKIKQNLEYLYEKAQKIVKKLKEKSNKNNREIKRKLIETRLEILANKSHQLSHMIGTLFESTSFEEKQKNLALIQQIYQAYAACLQEIGVITGDRMLSDQKIQELFLKNIESWKDPVQRLESLYKYRIDLGIKLRKKEEEQINLSENTTQSKEILVLEYELAHANLSIQEVEKELLNRIDLNKETRDLVSSLRQDNQKQIQLAVQIMRQLSREIKKQYGRAALEEIYQRKWTHTPWGEVLSQRIQENPLNWDEGNVDSFLRAAKNAINRKDNSFEGSVNELKNKIRSLNLQLEKKNLAEIEQKLEKELTETQLELYKLLYISTLSLSEKDYSIIKSDSVRFFQKILAFLKTYSKESSEWMDRYSLLQDKTFIAFLSKNFALEQRVLPGLLKEIENVYKQTSILKTLKKGTEEYLDTTIEINQSKLLILHIQRGLLKEIIPYTDLPVQKTFSLKIQTSIDASDLLAKENEKLILQADSLFKKDCAGQEMSLVGGSIPVTQKDYPAPWKLTNWGEILVQNKYFFPPLAESFKKLTDSYLVTIDYFQKKIDDLTSQIERKQWILDQATEEFQEKTSNLLGGSHPVKSLSTTAELDQLKNELRIQELHFLQTHLDRIIDLVGDRQAAINQMRKQIIEKEEKLLRCDDNPISVTETQKELRQLRIKLKTTEEETTVLNHTFDHFIDKYELAKKNLQKELNLSFEQITLRFAKLVIEQLLPNQLTAKLSDVSEIKKRMEYSRAGYSMIAEVSKLLSEICANAQSEKFEQSLIEKLQILDVQKFLNWAKTHPNTASHLAGDIFHVLSVLKQEGLVAQLESGLKTTLYTRAGLSKLHKNVIEPIESEEDFRYKAIADLFKRMPAAAGTLIGAVQSVNIESGFNIQTLTQVLWGATKGATLAQSAQNIRKFIPPDFEQTALIATQALQGEKIQKMLDDIRQAELINLGADVISKILRPMDIVEDIKGWWKKITQSNGIERTLRLGSQIAFPSVSLLTSGAIAYSAMPVGASTAALLFGTAGPIGILVAAGLIGAIATTTFPLMVLFNYLIDLSAYGQRTYKNILDEKKKMHEALVKIKFEDMKDSQELKKELKKTADRYFQDFQKIELFPLMHRVNPPEDFREIQRLAKTENIALDRPLEKYLDEEKRKRKEEIDSNENLNQFAEIPEGAKSLSRFSEFVKDAMHKKCQEKLTFFLKSIASKKNKMTPRQFVDAFLAFKVSVNIEGKTHLYSLEEYLDYFANEIFEKHITRLTHLSNISNTINELKTKKPKSHPIDSGYRHYKAESAPTIRTIGTIVEDLEKEEKQLHSDKTIQELRSRKKEIIYDLLTNEIETVLKNHGWLNQQLEGIVRNQFYDLEKEYLSSAISENFKPKKKKYKKEDLKNAYQAELKKSLQEKAPELNSAEQDTIFYAVLDSLEDQLFQFGE